MRFVKGATPSNFKDMSGQRFGILTVVRQAESRPGQRGAKAFWLCRCDCGKEKEMDGYSLRTRYYSCGCVRGTTATHGMSTTRTYRIWSGMLQRCSNPKISHFRYYGGKGVVVCKRWHDFANFLADMGMCPSGNSIERKDNDKGYYLENCCWLPLEKQTQNRSNTVYAEVDGEKICIEEAARRFGIKGPTARYRLNKSVSGRALDAPVLRGNTKLITFNGETLSMKDWAKRLGISRSALTMRFKYGWTIERALGEAR